MILKFLVLIIFCESSKVYSKNQPKKCIRETGDRNECLLQQVFMDQLFALNHSKSSNFISNFFSIIFYFIYTKINKKKGLEHLRNAQQFIAQEGFEYCMDVYQRELCKMAQSFARNTNLSISKRQSQSKVVSLYF
jgi:hypothetical protein